MIDCVNSVLFGSKALYDLYVCDLCLSVCVCVLACSKKKFHLSESESSVGLLLFVEIECAVLKKNTRKKQKNLLKMKYLSLFPLFPSDA